MTKELKLIRASLNGSLDGLELDNTSDVIEKSSVILMINELKELVDKAIELATLPQPVGDGEIKKVAEIEIDKMYGSGESELQKAFIMGAKWYRDKATAKPVVDDNFPTAEDIKRWYQLLVSKGEEAMRKDIQSTLR